MAFACRPQTFFCISGEADGRSWKGGPPSIPGHGAVPILEALVHHAKPLPADKGLHNLEHLERYVSNSDLQASSGDAQQASSNSSSTILSDGLQTGQDGLVQSASSEPTTTDDGHQNATRSSTRNGGRNRSKRPPQRHGMQSSSKKRNRITLPMPHRVEDEAVPATAPVISNRNGITANRAIKLEPDEVPDERTSIEPVAPDGPVGGQTLEQQQQQQHCVLDAPLRAAVVNHQPQQAMPEATLRHSATVGAQPSAEAIAKFLMTAGLRHETYQKWACKLATLDDCILLMQKHESLPPNVYELIEQRAELIAERHGGKAQ